MESAQVRALLRLRELILSGELAGGTRIAELAIVERIGVLEAEFNANLTRAVEATLKHATAAGARRVRVAARVFRTSPRSSSTSSARTNGNVTRDSVA